MGEFGNEEGRAQQVDTGGDRSLLAIATTQNDNDSIDDGIDYTEE